MWKQKISISIYNNNYYKRPVEEIVSLVKAIGFDGISPEWEKDVCLDSLIKKAKEEELSVFIDGVIKSTKAMNIEKDTFLELVKKGWDNNG